MNKVFITGTAIGNELGLCAPCTLDFSWLIENPATLIWADKIAITKKSLDIYLAKNNNKMDKTIKLILEIIKSNNVLDIVEINENLKKGAEPYYKKSVDEFKELTAKFPIINASINNENIVEEIKIKDYYYCLPYVASLYTQIGIANKIGANCLFSEKDYTYLENINKVDKARIYNEIFNVYFPNELIHSYAYEDEGKCMECINFNECKDNYLKEVEKNTLQILKWRDYDEIQMAKHEIDKIIKQKELLKENCNVEDIKKEFNEKQKRINKNIKKVFPKIRRWTNLATILSTPATIYSAVNSNLQATIVSASIGGVSKVIDESLKYYESKNNWVSFINKK